MKLGINLIFRNRKMKRRKAAQVWIETVIYTLIGLAIIGILLAVAKPKLDSMKDKMLIEQTIESMNKIDSKIYEVQKGVGNKRILDIKISKGKFIVDGGNDMILWVLDSTFQYSEQDVNITLGNLNILTKQGSPWTIELSAAYAVDLTYNSGDTLKELIAAPSPYSISIENLGVKERRIQIDLGLLS